MGPDAVILVFFEYVKAVYCHPAYLTYMQGISWEMLGWMKHKLESRYFSSPPTLLQATNPLSYHYRLAYSEHLGLPW